jgi:hypothetical protein
MRPLLAQCFLELGMLYSRRGQGEAARTALTDAITLCDAMDMTFWLQQAQTTLAQLP